MASGFEDGRRFWSCYLLTPQIREKRGRTTYVGFTTHPRRRIRQHNGEIKGGAYKTRRFRPWEMVAVVYGFRCKFSALQFEYAWQHPYVCRYTKNVLQPIKRAPYRRLGGKHSLARKLAELQLLLGFGTVEGG